MDTQKHLVFKCQNTCKIRCWSLLENPSPYKVQYKSTIIDEPKVLFQEIESMQTLFSDDSLLPYFAHPENVLTMLSDMTTTQ